MISLGINPAKLVGERKMKNGTVKWFNEKKGLRAINVTRV